MPIKTPDQKLRVFISSTINELAEERKLARNAVSKLRLIPVLFEMGARPHPPRDLYRAYLEQSHIFIGFYWNSYGWIAPDMDISGIEDEFNLSAGKPRLIYVKEPPWERHPRLNQLLNTIQKSNSVCYQKFSTPEELKELIENDLAVLLSEKFEAVIMEKEASGEKSSANLPIIRSRLIGREDELKTLRGLLTLPEVGLITLTGPGGTGKTRLSLQLLYEIKDDYKDGVHFVSLASLADATLVPATIAHELGLFDTGKQPILNTLLEYLGDKKTVLLLDNFEQVTDAAFSVSRILEQCPFVKIVVTSRTPLHLRGEYLYSLSPLLNPGNKVPASELQEYPAIQLFVQRAKEIDPQLILDTKNLEAISSICKRLDGLPLAIELAAARTKFFPPVLLLSKMKKMLDLLSQGPKDLPERQQTIRATIDWSINLLDESQQRFFRRLSVFSNNWNLEASEVVANWDRPEKEAMETTEKLIDLGLVESYSHEAKNEEIEIRFRMLQTVKEYASEILNSSNDLEKTEKLHADYFVGKANELQPLTWTSNAAGADNWFDKEYENLRLAFTNSLKNRNWNYCWQIVGTLSQFWLRHGGYSEAFEWMKLANISVDIEKDKSFRGSIDAEFRARTYLATGMLKYFAGNYSVSAEYLAASGNIYSAIGNLKGLGRSKAYLGLAKLNLGDITASDLTEAIQLGHRTQDVFSILFASAFLTEAFIAAGYYEKAKTLLEETERNAKEFGSILGCAMVSLQKGNLYYLQNQFSTASGYYVKSIEEFADAGFDALNGWCYINLGGCLTEQKEFEEARKYLEKGLGNARERGEKPMILGTMLYFSNLFYAMGDKAKAVRIFSAVEGLKTRIDAYNAWSTNKAAYEKACYLINDSLNDPLFANDVDTGKRFSLEQLIALVLEKDKQGVSV